MEERYGGKVGLRETEEGSRCKDERGPLGTDKLEG